MIIFSKIREMDLPITMKWRRDESVVKYLTSIDNDLEKQKQWLKKVENDDTKKYRIVTCNERMVGVFVLSNIDCLNKRLEIGGFIPRENQGLIYNHLPIAAACIECIKHYTFQILNFNKIVSTVPKFNHIALKLNLRCGFEIEGVLKEWFFHNGEFHDDYILSFLKKDWKPIENFDYYYNFHE